MPIWDTLAWVMQVGGKKEERKKGKKKERVNMFFT
jgi:hypothetical protein